MRLRFCINRIILKIILRGMSVLATPKILPSVDSNQHLVVGSRKFLALVANVDSD